MMKFIYPAKNLQGKWNETTDSDNSKGWKSERYLRYPTKRFYWGPAKNNQHVTYP
jgi:hypothetical protein